MAGTKITSNVIADDAIAAAHIGDGVITTAHISSSATPTFTDLTLTGNLTVQGTTTTLDTATLNVEDKNITLNYGSGDTSGSANGAGITIQDAVDASNDATILWDTSNDEFDFSHKINVASITVGDGHTIGNDGDDNLALASSSGENIIIDSADDIILDADGGDWIFRDGGTEKARFKGEKLGIGINPSEMLDIQSNSGDARIRLDAPSGSDTEIKFFNAASAQYTIGHDDATDNFVLGGANVDTPLVNVNKSGKVDIGNNGFLYGKLTVTQTSGADDDEGGIGIVDSSNGRSMRLYCSSTKSFINSGNGGGQLLVLNEGAGQVSIGNDDAQSMHSNANKLVVGTGSGDQGMSIFAGTSVGMYAFARAVGNNTDAYDGGMSYDGSRNLKFHTNAGSTRMTINGTGLVGIGETSPSATLHINTSTNSPLLVESTHGDGGYIELQLSDSGGAGSLTGYIGDSQAIVSGGDAGDLAIRAQGDFVVSTGGNSQRFQINSSGSAIFSQNDSTVTIGDAGTNAATVKSSANDELYVGGDDNDGYFRIKDDGNTQVKSPSNFWVNIDGADRYGFDSVRIYPGSTNTYDLGLTSHRWRTVYGVNSNFSSDARLKTTLTSLTDNEIKASKLLAKEIGTYKWLDQVASEGDKAKINIGLTAQKIIEIMESCSLNALDYQLVTFSEWDATEAKTEKRLGKDGKVEEYTIPATPKGDEYGVCYEQLNQFIAAGFNARLEALEG